MGLLSRASPKIKNDLSLPSRRGIVTTQLINGAPLNLVSTTANALDNSDVFSAINRISSDIASAKFRTTNTYAAQVLNNPSKVVSRFTFWQGVLVDALINGNAYVPIEGMQLNHLRPIEVSEIKAGSHNAWMTYNINPMDGSKSYLLNQSQILHFRLMPDAGWDYLIGRSPLESLAYERTISDDSKRATLNSIQNQISPIGVLTIPASDLNPGDTEEARRDFEKMNSGSNAGRLMVLTDEAKYEQLDVKADVFKALTENADYSANQISKAFGIPVDMLGGGKSTESEHSNIDSVKGAYVSDLNSYINPILDEIKLKMNCPDLKLDVKSAIDVDDSIMVNQVNSMMQAGVIDQKQAQILLKQSGALPMNLIPSASEGGESQDDQN
jgi:HK97 family phage portal protein